VVDKHDEFFVCEGAGGRGELLAKDVFKVFVIGLYILFGGIGDDEGILGEFCFFEYFF
jgi:hypothetical protein